jgi:hypothetical protein
VASFASVTFYPRKKRNTDGKWIGDLGGSQSRSACWGRNKLHLFAVTRPQFKDHSPRGIDTNWSVFTEVTLNYRSTLKLEFNMSVNEAKF